MTVYVVSVADNVIAVFTDENIAENKVNEWQAEDSCHYTITECFLDDCA